MMFLFLHFLGLSVLIYDFFLFCFLTIDEQTVESELYRLASLGEGKVRHEQWTSRSSWISPSDHLPPLPIVDIAPDLQRWMSDSLEDQPGVGTLLDRDPFLVEAGITAGDVKDNSNLLIDDEETMLLPPERSDTETAVAVEENDLFDDFGSDENDDDFLGDWWTQRGDVDEWPSEDTGLHQVSELMSRL